MTNTLKIFQRQITSVSKMVREKTLLNRVEKYFRNKNFHTCTEVPLLNNSIDLVAYKKDFSKIIAVEVKVMDWKRALQQATLYKLCAHQVYVAMWQKFLHRADLDPLSDLGIGVISVDGHARRIVKPKNSHIIHSSLMRNVKNYVTARRVNG